MLFRPLIQVNEPASDGVRANTFSSYCEDFILKNGVNTFFLNQFAPHPLQLFRRVLQCCFTFIFIYIFTLS